MLSLNARHKPKDDYISQSMHKARIVPGAECLDESCLAYQDQISQREKCLLNLVRNFDSKQEFYSLEIQYGKMYHC